MKLPSIHIAPETRRRWGVRLGWGVAGLLLCWLILWAGLPPLLKWQIESQATQKLGRTVSVGDVKVQPWSLEVTIDNLAIAQAHGTEPQISIAHVYADLELQSLLRLAPVVDALSIEQPKVVLKHLGRGHYDIDDIITRLAAEPPSPEPARFSVFNIRIADGQIDYRDEPVATTHRLRKLRLDIPFLSNLGERRSVATTPHLAFQLNDDDFKLDAITTPFAPDLRTELNLDFPRVHLAPYLPYWPAALPVKPTTGSALLKLKIAFDQTNGARVKLGGTLEVDDLTVAETRDGAPPLLQFKRLLINIADAMPLERRMNVERIALDQPAFSLRRDARGELNLQHIIGQLSGPPTPRDKQWQMQIHHAELTSGTVSWRDASTQPAADLTLEALSFNAEKLHWPPAAAAPLAATVSLGKAALKITGEWGAAGARAHITATDLPLAAGAPYLRQVFLPAVSGRLAFEAEASINPDAPGQWQVSAPRIEVSALAVGDAKVPAAAWRSLLIEGLSAEGAGRTANLTRVSLTEPVLSLTRNDQSRWMFEDWLPHTSGTRAAPEGPAWALTIGEARVVGGAANFEDASFKRAVKLAATGVNLSVKDLKPFAAKQAAMPLSVALDIRQIRRRATTAGKLSYTGNLRLAGPAAPLRASGDLRAEDFPLHALAPYFADHLNLELNRADLSVRGKLDASLPPEGLALQLAGDVAVEDLLTSTLSPREDLLEWKSLNLRGLNAELVGSALRKLRVNETALSDYFARIIIRPEGRINLQDLVRAESGTAATSATAAPAPDIRFGPIALTAGRVLYSDQFIKPNYTANITELSGRLGSFSNQSTEMAELSLRGRAEGTATLEVEGKLNPLASPLALDLRGKVRDLELPPLSPYSAKYAGYGIERGKLSMEVAYRIAPDGLLTASNQITLNQLVFGEQVTSPDAPNLPVKLAVSLLADRNGVIDINLPISGSINDPEFRVGPIIVRLIFNLIGKAITSPFALLGAAFGGGEELSEVDFAPGESVLTESAKTRLVTVAKALENRPALRVTVIGEADIDTEKEGFRRAQLSGMLAAEKRRQIARDGQAAASDASVSAAEIPALLKAVYRRADIIKPRNVVGLAKDIPHAEMEALLLASIPVSGDAMRELALARSVAVRDFLAAQSVANERLYLGAPAAQRSGERWTPRAELKLGTQ